MHEKIMSEMRAREKSAGGNSTATATRLVTAEAVRAGHPDKFCD